MIRALAVIIILTLGALVLASFLTGRQSYQPPCSDCWKAL